MHKLWRGSRTEHFPCESTCRVCCTVVCAWRVLLLLLGRLPGLQGVWLPLLLLLLLLLLPACCCQQRPCLSCRQLQQQCRLLLLLLLLPLCRRKPLLLPHPVSGCDLQQA